MGLTALFSRALSECPDPNRRRLRQNAVFCFLRLRFLGEAFGFWLLAAFRPLCFYSEINSRRFAHASGILCPISPLCFRRPRRIFAL